MVLKDRNFYLFVIITVGACCSGYMRNTKEWAAARGGWAGAACEDSLGRLALVEHFFSLVFAEFHRSPPACVCVQMCDQQATYCYPNGCLRREPPPPPRAAAPSSPPPRAAAHTPATAADSTNSVVAPVESEKLLPVGLRSEHYEDAKTTYKNTPSTNGFKYSARERPRHKGIISMLKDQEDQLSVVKSRWPMKKYYGGDSGDLLRGESHGRNYFFSTFFDDKDTVFLNQNSKRAANQTRQHAFGEVARSQQDAGVMVRVETLERTTDATEQYTRLYKLDPLQPHPARYPTRRPATHTTTHTTHTTHTTTPSTTPPADTPHSHTQHRHTDDAPTTPSLDTTLSTRNDSDDFHAFYT